jgi:DNA (cytosine-5)-methyltransferase 1
MTTKVLNLYAGIGGNRKEWEDVDVTAVEWDSDKAEVYKDHFPEDTVIETDAHKYLLEHMDEYEFIWASPPCPTHSNAKYGGKLSRINDLEYPDMKLYQEIILLQKFHKGDYVVENVESYYDPLIDYQSVARHYWWSNFHIPDFDSNSNGHYESIEALQEIKGFDLSDYDLPKEKKRKMLRNCVLPELGKHIFESRRKQTTLI